MPHSYKIGLNLLNKNPSVKGTMCVMYKTTLELSLVHALTDYDRGTPKLASLCPLKSPNPLSQGGLKGWTHEALSTNWGFGVHP